MPESSARAKNFFPREKAFWWLAGLIFVLGLIIYLPVLNGGFVFDDDEWLTTRTEMYDSPGQVLGFWLHPGRLPQYYPLTATTFALDYQLWGLWTLPYHVENVLLHLVAALLLFQLLTRLRIPGAWLAAAIFAVHPVMVASVAWITERRNVLSLALFLGALLAYERFRPGMTGTEETAAGDESIRKRFYALTLLLFLAALLAKTAIFPLPAVILVIIWWRTGRIRWQQDVIPLLPLFALAIGLCAITYSIEQRYVGHGATADVTLTLVERCLVAGHVFWFYPGKLFWPANLCLVNPHWQVDAHSAAQWLYPVTALGLVVAAVLWARKLGRGPAAALFYYAGTLFPVLGFLNVNAMRFSYVWDHWAYLSLIGIIVLAAALVARWAESIGRPVLVCVCALALLPTLTVLARARAATYRSPQTLWEATLKVNPDCGLAEQNLGLVADAKGDVAEALKHYQNAIRLMPDLYEALFNDAADLANTGQTNESVAMYRRAIALNPGNPAAHYNLAFTLAKSKQVDAAIAEYQEVLRLTPDNADARYNLGTVWFTKGRFDEAMKEFQEADRLRPNSYPVNNFSEALGLNNQAWALATNPDPGARNGAQAVELAQEARDKAPVDQPLILGTLAAAYAEAGRFDEAVQTADQACKLGAMSGDTNLVQRNRELMRLYQAHQAYHEGETPNSNH